MLLLQGKGKKGRRKVDRTITYRGPPFLPDVTPEQRRVMLRRAANCESARRVRERRHEELERLTQKVSSTPCGHPDAAVQEGFDGHAAAALW